MEKYLDNVHKKRYNNSRNRALKNKPMINSTLSHLLRWALELGGQRPT
jgi:hypothetical protein